MTPATPGILGCFVLLPHATGLGQIDDICRPMRKSLIDESLPDIRIIIDKNQNIINVKYNSNAFTT